MSLSIHYRLESSADDDREIHALLGNLRQKALDLPVKEVGDIVDLSGKECDHWQYEAAHPLSWMLVQAEHNLWRKSGGGGRVPPTRVIAFSVWPGEGCEQANFGLCRYPEKFTPEKQEELETGISGWVWESSCKTHYASNPACGGIVHFLRCHLSIIAMLDQAKDLGLLGIVKDEGGYWEERDIPKLATLVGEINVSMAAFAGALKDLLGSSVEAEIAKYPDFEHLEAKGRKTK